MSTYYTPAPMYYTPNMPCYAHPNPYYVPVSRYYAQPCYVVSGPYATRPLPHPMPRPEPTVSERSKRSEERRARWNPHLHHVSERELLRSQASKSRSSRARANVENGDSSRKFKPRRRIEDFESREQVIKRHRKPLLTRVINVTLKRRPKDIIQGVEVVASGATHYKMKLVSLKDAQRARGYIV